MIIGISHGIWTISTLNMTYTRPQNYRNTEVGKYGIQTFVVGRKHGKVDQTKSYDILKLNYGY